MPTGAGKTVVAHAIVEGAVAKGNRVLVVAHTRQIIEQTARRFECGMYMAKHNDNTNPLVGSIQTIARRGAPPFDVLIVDEAHHATSASYAGLVRSAPVVIGLTATPQRLDGRGLGEVGFGCIIEPATVDELIHLGYLVEPIIYAKPFAGSGLKVERGEFTAESAEEAMKDLHGQIGEHWAEHGVGRCGVAFTCSIEHGHAVAASLRAHGARAEMVSGEDSKDRRDAVLAWLEQRAIDIVVNCQLYGEGWDLPALDLCIMARPTKSLTVYRQQLGRIMRPKGHRPILLDHAGNTARHGFVTEILEWKLEGRVKRESLGAPGKQCPECFAYIPLACETCPECGAEFKKVRSKGETDDELVKIERPLDHEGVYSAFLDRAWAMRHRVGKARRDFMLQFKEWPNEIMPKGTVERLEKKHYPCIEHIYENKISKGGFHYTRCTMCLEYFGAVVNE